MTGKAFERSPRVAHRNLQCLIASVAIVDGHSVAPFWSELFPKSCGAEGSFACLAITGSVSSGIGRKSRWWPCRGSAVSIKSIQIGKAALAPVSLLPRVFFSSKPTHTPQLMEGENPTNQASVKSLVVPVLPATAYFMRPAATAVPCNTTSRSIDV